MEWPKNRMKWLNENRYAIYIIVLGELALIIRNFLMSCNVIYLNRSC